MNQDNCYILLELDPTEDQPAAIETAITKKQREWSALRTHPSKGTWANQCLAQIPSIRRTMSDPESRRVASEEAKRILLKQQKEQFEELDQAIELLASKGFIYEEEISSLTKRKAFKSFKEADIRARVKVDIRKNNQTKNKKATVRPLEKSIADQITGNLEIVGKSSLYDLLGLQPSSTIKRLTEATNEQYEKIRKIAANNPKLTAELDLLGKCKSIFKSEEERKRYDKTLDNERFKYLDKLIDIAGGDGEIDANEFEHLVNKGAKSGLGKEEVIDYIKKVCRKKKWGLQLPGRDAKVYQAQACGICGALNNPKAKFCSSCSFPMEVECPNCSAINTSSTINCPDCGYSIADMPNALPLIRMARGEMNDGDYTKAEKKYARAESFWKGHPDIKAGKQKLADLRRKVDAAYQKTKELVQKELYYQARESLMDLKKMPGGEERSSHLESRINQRVKQAEQWLEKAKTATTNFQIEEAYGKALEYCKDCKEAINGLAGVFPDTPGKLVVNKQQGVVNINWEPSKSSFDIIYRVVRKENAYPAHQEDGVQLGETAQNSYTDKTAVAGATYYYAVFSQRGEKFSKKGRISLPVILTAPVKDLVAHPSDRAINLTWTAPPNLSRIEVWAKKNSIPKQPGDGMLLPGVRKDGATHLNLVNGETYGYLVVPIFKGPAGKDLPGEGEGLYSSAALPPEPVTDLNINRGGDLAEVTWSQGKEVVELFFSKKPFSQKRGEVFSYALLGAVGTQIPVHQKGKATFRPSKHGLYYILPVTIKGATAVAGKVETLHQFEEVDNLTVEVKEDELRVRMDFPKEVDQVLVTCADRFNKSDPFRYRIEKREFLKTGYFKISQLPDYFSELLIEAKTLIQVPGEEPLYSDGVGVHVKLKKPVLDFSITRSGLWSMFSRKQKFDLVVQLEGNLDTLLELVVKENNKLISFNDPKIERIMDIDCTMFEEDGTLNTSFQYQPSGKAVKNLFFSILPKKPEEKEEVTIRQNGLKVKL